jgi:hypothetical protein
MPTSLFDGLHCTRFSNQKHTRDVVASLCSYFSGVGTLDSGFLQRNTGMMRYEMNKVAGADAWIVLDTTTGFPAVVKGVPQIGLSLDDADDFADLLNRLDAEAQLATKN